MSPNCLAGTIKDSDLKEHGRGWVGREGLRGGWREALFFFSDSGPFLCPTMLFFLHLFIKENAQPRT